jgi:hypothetical protein
MEATSTRTSSRRSHVGPRGELELPTVDLELPGKALAVACRVLGVFCLAKHDV